MVVGLHVVHGGLHLLHALLEAVVVIDLFIDLHLELIQLQRCLLVLILVVLHHLFAQVKLGLHASDITT